MKHTLIYGKVKNINRQGILMAGASYFIWGIMPLYWKLLKPIDSGVIIFYRIILVAAVSLFIVLKTEGKEALKAAVRPEKAKLLFLLAGAFITANWSLYVWAVNAGFVIQTSIGHYMEPLLIALAGVFIFREKFTRSKFIAFLLAISGVMVIIIAHHEVPVLALTLGSTFAVYAAVKKYIHCSSMVSLFYETIFFVPAAAAVVLWLEITGRGALAAATGLQYLLLMTVGAVTVLVLWLFSESETKTSLSNIGVIAYLSPTISLLLGIFVFHESFDRIQMLAFSIIWAGLFLYAAGSCRNSRQQSYK